MSLRLDLLAADPYPKLMRAVNRGGQSDSAEWAVSRSIDLDAGFYGSSRGVLPPSSESAYLTKQEFLDKSQAGEIVGLSAKTIEREIQRGNLLAYKLAGRVRIKRADLDVWIRENAVPPSAHDV